jgi:hypothetical protein
MKLEELVSMGLLEYRKGKYQVNEKVRVLLEGHSFHEGEE